MKHFLYATYGWWILLGIVILFALGFWKESTDGNIWAACITSIGALLTTAYFIQKQKIEETELFVALFEKFNARYAALQGALDDICGAKPADPLTDHEKSTLVRYFNLCAEEYLMFEKGFLFPSVWKSWHRGMSAYFGHPRIIAFRREELSGGSYYGLEREFANF